MTRLRVLIIAILSTLIVNMQEAAAQIVINEFLASNNAGLRSADFNENADWIELYNATDAVIDLSGYYLSDDINEPFKWPIPAGTELRPGWHTLFWCDGRDTLKHTNFALSKDGEYIGLTDPTGTVVDSLTFPAQYEDISYGRQPDGGELWFYFDAPTPLQSNDTPALNGIAAAPEFSLPAGFYSGPQTVQLQNGDQNGRIRYTLDGADPDQSSPLYTQPLIIDTTTVVRARVLTPGYKPSAVITRTYLIDESSSLPVISLATDPGHMWDEQSGIYVEGNNGISGYCSSEPRNWNQPWEKPVHLEMFESGGEPAFNLDAGMQIGGGCTRLYPQKTLAIYVRSVYGPAKIHYQIFADKPITEFNNILLRNGGQDWWRALIRDGTIHTLVKDYMDIDWQAYRPAVVFLNGAFFGVHGLREKHNEHYLESNHGVDADAIDILSGNAQIKQGSAEHYEAMIDFIETHDLSVAQNYASVESQMDINEYLNYVITEIYFANIDWPGGNIKYWRPQGPDNKWRWILFDTDLGFGAHYQGQYDSNTLANATAESATYYANPPWSTFLLRSLLTNTAFRQEFIQRFASHMNVTFYPQRVLSVIDSLQGAIAPEIPRHIQKWPRSTSFNDGWMYHINVMREFAEKRPDYVFQQIIEKFNLGGTARLQLQNNMPQMGSIFVHGVEIPDATFSGVYFKDVPVKIEAKARYGYRFTGWQGVVESDADSIELILTGNSSLQATFEKANPAGTGGLCINEIMALNETTFRDNYGEYDDWIELFNNSAQAVDIGGMYMTDDLSQPDMWQIPATFPDSTTIPPGGFMVLWADRDTGQGIRHMDFKLSGDGEQIGLARQTDSGFVYVDTLVFGSQTTDVSYGRFNDGAHTWKLMAQATPGQANIFTGMDNEKGAVPLTVLLHQNYPNPFNSTTLIRFTLDKESPVTLSLYSITGRKIKILTEGRRSAGAHKRILNAANLPSGVYIYRLKTPFFQQSRKLILLR